MIWKLFKWYEVGKLAYDKVLKPIYLELRKDAYAEEAKATKRTPKKKSSKKRLSGSKGK